VKEDNAILERPLESFSTSEEFGQMCQLNGFNTLREILLLEVNDLLKRPEFNLRMLKELYQLLEDNHLEKVLKE